MKNTGLLVTLLSLLLIAGCSTTKMLAEDEARLASNKVNVLNKSSYNASSLTPYIKQKAGQNRIFLYVYNMQNGKGGGWDRFCQRLGQAPVVFDENMVDASVRSIRDHLQYEGYYNSVIEPEIRVKNKIAKVNYYVTLGKRFPIRDIEYQVRDTALARLFAADSANYTLHSGDYLSEESLEEESERVAQYFRNNGYWGFSKK